jgi:hypothetical protein
MQCNFIKYVEDWTDPILKNIWLFWYLHQFQKWDPDFDHPNSVSSPSENQPCSLVSSTFCCFFTLIKSLFKKRSCQISAIFKVSKTNSAGPLKSSVHDSYVWNINGWTNPCWNSLGSTGQQCRSYSHFSTAQPTTQEHWAPIGDCAASPSGWCDSWPHSAVWPSGWKRFFVLVKSLVWLKHVFIRDIYISIDIIYIEPHLQLILMTTKILDMIDNQWPCGTRRLVQLGQWIRLWFHQLAVLLPVVGETPHCLLTRVEGPLKKSVRYPTWCP